MGFFGHILAKLGFGGDQVAAARKALAAGLPCPDALMGDSARMNMWMHKNVLAPIAANGGKVPKELLD